MLTRLLIATVCLAGLSACGSPSPLLRGALSASTKTETITMYQSSTYSNKTKTRQKDGDQLGEWIEVQERLIDCSGNDVLLVWGQTAVRFPGIWPADEGLVLHGQLDNPPLQLTFPAPLNGNAKPVQDVVWSIDKLIIDGAPYDLVSGNSYVFTKDGLEALSSDAADER